MLDELASFPLRFSDLLPSPNSQMNPVEALAFKNQNLDNSAEGLFQRVAITVSMCFVPACWLNVHDEVNDSCLGRWKCGFLNLHRNLQKLRCQQSGC